MSRLHYIISFPVMGCSHDLHIDLKEIGLMAFTHAKIN